MRSKRVTTKTMYDYDSERDTYHVDLRVANYADLFNKWDFSPYYEKDLEPELVDYLVGSFQEIPAGSNVVVSFHLPKAVHNPDLEKQFTSSVYYHLSYARSQLEQERRALRRDTTRYAGYGVAFVVLAQFLPNILEGLILVSLVSEGLFIGGWVLLWEAFSHIFFRSRRLKRERELNERLQNATYRFIYEDTGGPIRG
jgi:hypothetical protein